MHTLSVILWVHSARPIFSFGIFTANNHPPGWSAVVKLKLKYIN